MITLRRFGRVSAWAALATSAMVGWAQPAPPALPALRLDPAGVTVSGLSSGGYMAAQFEVAYSKSVKGAAVVAGGPYGCSLGSEVTASLACSCPYSDEPGSGPLALLSWASRSLCTVLPSSILTDRALHELKINARFIDPPANLRRHRVWLYVGAADPVVDPSIVDALQAFYAQVGVPGGHLLRSPDGPAAGHGMPVIGNGTADGTCGPTRSPYLNACGIDGAGELLKWLYDMPRAQPGQPQADALRRFDQRPYRLIPGFDGLDDTGWLYVPASCEAPASHCKLHVAFHGCEQSQSFVVDGQPLGDVFATQAGYNRWAESLGIVVLYPQVKASEIEDTHWPARYNPKGCWDFWGYTSPDGDAALLPSHRYFEHREGPQMRAVKAMIDALVGDPPP